MISYLKGIILHREPGKVILRNESVGFTVFVDQNTEINMKKTGEEQELFTSLQIRENEWKIFGFDSLRKLEVFDLLLNANKIGPRLALSFLSSLPAEHIIQAIVEKNNKGFGKISGVGEKLQKQVILDCLKGAERLAEKYGIVCRKEIPDAEDEAPNTAITASGVAEALQRLGFTNSEIRRSLKSVKEMKSFEKMTESQILSACLRSFSA